jgi:type II secretory pathway pseudopilin PulG
MNHRIRRQEGFALVTAILVMAMCLMIGIALAALTGRQQGDSRMQRECESSFAAAEGALNAQIFQLSRQWPSRSDPAYVLPAQCAPAVVNPNCPTPSTLTKAFTGADYNKGIAWTTEVHDNDTAAAQYYNDATVRQEPTWDSNGDGLMWVRAQAVVRGKRRTLVALIRAERIDTLFPRNVITANTVTISDDGNQNYINTAGSYLILRCNKPGGGQYSDDACKNWSRSVQVGPNATVNVVPNQASALSPETIDRMRDYARGTGKYFDSGCPDLAGEVVFVERMIPGCSYTGNDEWNSDASPGILIIGSGSLSLSGNTTYHGIVYDVNGSDGVGPQSSAPDVVELHGNGCVSGAVVIDGPGGLTIGNSHGASKCNGNLGYLPNAANNLHAYGTAGIVQNSFREIVATN